MPPLATIIVNILLNSIHKGYIILFTQPLRSGKIWHKVNF